jgi:NAD(P)-dependent dehydrogenase (short-subunit alcohol dehydrogenase family)
MQRREMGTKPSFGDTSVNVGFDALSPFAAATLRVGPQVTDNAINQILRRLGEPDDVAAVAVWLCSEEARFVTGQTILCDGGFTIPGLR